MSDLSELIPSLQRRVAPPGTFGTHYPDATDDDMTGMLGDGFARAQLDGYFVKPSVDLDPNTFLTAPDLTVAQGALVVLYAGVIMIESTLLNLSTSQKYVAGPVQYETQQSANVLSALLKALNGEKEELRQIAISQGTTAATVVADAYFMKAVGVFPGAESFIYGPDVDRAFDYHEPWPLIP